MNMRWALLRAASCRLLPLIVGLYLGCAGAEKPAVSTPKTAPSSTAAPAASTPDPLGPRPTPEAPKAFTPPAPAVQKTAQGMTLWLIERHSLPYVSVTFSLPTGSSADPPDQPGLAFITASMLDEGAGTRNAVDLSSAINNLGANLSIQVTSDGSFVSLTVLKKNFAPAFALMSDVLARPKFDRKEWKRVSELWRNGLRSRADDPSEVARVVSSVALFGPTGAYGHPSDGFLRGAQKIDLNAVRGFYQAHWHPEQATLVVTGDVTSDELQGVVQKELQAWKGPKTAAKAPAKDLVGQAQGWTPPRLVIVDRPEAPQSVVTVIRPGVAASDPKAPLLDLVNTALGGSFSSRLMQNLREDHGWTYGAFSAFTETRAPGAFVARAAVYTEHTGDSLREMLGELNKMAASGMTDEEFSRVLAQDRGDLVHTYEAVDSISRRLGKLAVLGVGADFDQQASIKRQKSSLADLQPLYPAVSAKDATVLVVGPKAQVLSQLAPLGLGEPVYWDAEGLPVSATPAVQPPNAPKAPKGKPAQPPTPPKAPSAH